MGRKWIGIVLGGLTLALLGGAFSALRAPAVAAEPATITVYKTPTWGCCGGWIEHAQESGLETVTRHISWEELDRMATEHSVPGTLRSCHLSLVEGYVVEGHVPANAIRKLLRERPAVAGIAVPGMPIGSPGMEQGGKKEPFSVIAFTREGTTSVFARSR
ncbi:MAG: DUF411 domain-containing protein [Gemmatimonadota bacterium]|nr:DUF411 domain-containing protein [Gemmatimonadota bacterium]